MTKMTEAIQEEINRPDAIYLSLKAGKGETITVVDFEDVDADNGDYGNYDNLVVVGIPLYPDAETALDNAMRYVFNKIEIHDLIKQNKALKLQIGNC